MPLDNPRSGLYRSFMMCDDPGGVVESGVVRKQKSRRSVSTDDGSRKSEPTGKEREQRRRPPPEEKTEMSRKIKQEIGSSLDDSSSSLQLLRVSRGIQKLNNAIESWSKGLRYEDRPEDIAKDLLRGALDLEESLAMLGRFQDTSSEHIKQKPTLRFQRSMSERYGERNEKGFEKRRISDYGSSRDCYEELRNAIKESFLKQNLALPERTAGEKVRACRSNVALSSGNVSTSSSQSSTVYGNDSGSTKSSLSWDVPPRNSVKGPSLIARLMGLEEFPEELAKSRTVLMDKPETKKPISRSEEQMKKKEILETVQSKGATRSNSVREIVLQSPPSSPLNICHPAEIPLDNSSPIVLIRPLRAPEPETEAKPRGKTPVLPKKPRMQGEIHPRMISRRKEATGSGRTNTKVEVGLGLTKRDRGFKEMISKAEDNAAKKIKPIASGSTKTSNTVTKAPTPVITNKKPVGVKGDGKVKDNRHRPHDTGLRPPVDPVKHKSFVNTSDLTKNKSSTERRSKSSSEQKRIRAKKVGAPTRLNAKKKTSQEDDEGSDLTLENSPVSSGDVIGSANQPSTEEETSSPDIHAQGSSDNREISSSDASTEQSDDKNNAEISTDVRQYDTEISLKSFLSNSQPFLSYAEKFFVINTKNINVTTSTSASISQNRNNFVMISDQRLSLDCAKEISRRKSLQLSKGTRPGRICISLDELLIGISDGFEALRRYSNTSSGQQYLSDNINMMLEKDLKGRNTEMASEMWDLGWRTGFRIDDTDRVVIGVAKLILFGLIEEILS